MSWMADFHRCVDCKFAGWKRTEAGRLSPSGDGRCKWEYKPPVIAAAYSWSWWSGRAPTPDGGFINRRKPIERCPVFQRSA